MRKKHSFVSCLLKRFLAVALLPALLLCAFAPQTPESRVYAGASLLTAAQPGMAGWVKENGEWRYYRDGVMLTNGWAKDSHGWCWLGADGRIAASKWIKDDGQWYYLKADGYMAANEWAKDSIGWCWMLGNGRQARDTHITYNGEEYYIDASGYAQSVPPELDGAPDSSANRFLLTGATFPTRLEVGEPFSIRGTLTGNNDITRVEVGVTGSSGKYLDGFHFTESEINQQTYSLEAADSVIKFGRLPKGTYEYRVTATDRAGSVQVLCKSFTVGHQEGWVKEGADWRFYQSDGSLLTNGWAKDSIGWCWMDASGRITKGAWIEDGAQWYYLKSNGYMAASEWAKDSAGWMWMNASGRVTKSKWLQYGGAWYYLKSSGYMAASEWAKDSAGWCWLLASGKMAKKQWIKDRGTQYYLDTGGHWLSSLTVEGATMLTYDVMVFKAIGKQPYSGPCGLYSMAYCRLVIDGKFPLGGYSSYRDRIIQGYGGGGSYANWTRAGGKMQLYSSNSSLYRAVYDEIAAGRPCIMNCYNTGTGNNHFFAVIGFVEGTTRSNVTFNSFIILDPETGTQRLLSQTPYRAPSGSPIGPEIVRF